MHKFIQWLLAVGLLAATAMAIAQGERFPNKTIQIIATSTPGSQSDTLMRFLGTEVAKSLGQPVIVVNKASAAGTIGAEQARRAAPDGYTVFMGGNTTMAANVHLVKNLGYDPVRDFEPVTLLTSNPLVLVVRADLPVRSVAELVAYAKARPGQLNYGTGNSGNKVAAQLLQALTGISATEISFTGASPAMLELVAGRLDFIVSDPLVAEPFIKQGSIRALAVTAAARPASLSGVPTMGEAGVPGYAEITSFLSFHVPRGTPRSVIDTLHDAFVKVIHSKEGQEQYVRLGLVPKTSTPAELSAFVTGQIELWGRLVKVAGMQPQ